MSKYGNKRVKADGYTFDSQAEYRRYFELKLLEQAGEITSLKVHPRYTILGEEQYYREGENGEVYKLPKVSYVGDFEYIENGWRVCEDVKGVQTAVFKLKANMFQRTHPHIRFRIVPA